VQEYKVQIGIFLYLVLPQLLSRYMVTGAFEIYLDERQVWSRIAEGRFPTEEEIVRVLAAAGLKHS
jgi:selT/selW/selH-like putative selenoprotein